MNIFVEQFLKTVIVVAGFSKRGMSPDQFEMRPQRGSGPRDFHDEGMRRGPRRVR